MLKSHALLACVLVSALANVITLAAAEGGLPPQASANYTPSDGAMAVSSAEHAKRQERGKRARQQIAKMHANTQGQYQRSDAPIEAFNSEEFKKDPESYLEQAVPARASAPGKPGIGLPPLQADGPGLIRLAREGSTTLRVRCAANAPCSFYCPAMLVFENELPAITVQADAEGWATVTVTAPAGVTGDAQVLIASPKAEGQACVTFLIGDQP